MTEDERKRKASSPGRAAWNAQMHKVRLFHQLTYNTDYRNVRNVLVDPKFRVLRGGLLARVPHPGGAADAGGPRRFLPRGAREAPRARPSHPRGALGAWLEGRQIDGLLARRDRILALVKERIAEKGRRRSSTRSRSRPEGGEALLLAAVASRSSRVTNSSPPDRGPWRPGRPELQGVRRPQRVHRHQALGLPPHRLDGDDLGPLLPRGEGRLRARKERPRGGGLLALPPRESREQLDAVSVHTTTVGSGGARSGRGRSPSRPRTGEEGRGVPEPHQPDSRSARRSASTLPRTLAGPPPFSTAG